LSAGQDDKAEEVVRETLAGLEQLTHMTDWPTPICHPDVRDDYSSQYQLDVQFCIYGAQCLLGKCLVKQRKCLDEARLMLAAGIAGWTDQAESTSTPALYNDIFLMQVELLELQCLVGEFDGASATVEMLGAKLARSGQGEAEISAGFMLNGGMSMALDAAQNLDHAIGKDGAESVVPAAHALYERMLVVLTGAEGGGCSNMLLKAKVHRRFWQFARLSKNAELKERQQQGMVELLREAGRWDGTCSICLETLDSADENLEVTQCLHCFHGQCIQMLAQRGERAESHVSHCFLKCRCPQCRFPIKISFARVPEGSEPPSWRLIRERELEL
jgi:hypothetical protein